MSFTAIALFFYVAALSWIVWRGRSEAATGDMYNIFGRRANILRATAGYLSLIGAGELVTIAQLGYQSGFALLWFPSGVATGFLLISIFGGGVRERAEKLQVNTVVGLVVKQYGKLAGIGLMITYVIALGALLTIQFIVGGQLLSDAAGLDPKSVSTIIAVVIVIYLLIGGYVAVLSTDILRFVFLGIALVILIFGVYVSRGANLVSEPSFESFSAIDGLTYYFLGVFGAVCAGDVWQTVFASASTKVVRLSMISAAICFLGFGFLIGLLGMEAKISGNVPHGTELPALILAYKYVVPHLLSPLLALVIVGSIMATADTEIWVLSSSVASLVRSEKSDVSNETNQKEIRKITRFVIPIVGVIGLSLAITTNDSQSVYEVLLVLLASVAPAVIAALFGVANSSAVTFSIFASLIAFFAALIFFALEIPSYATFLPAILGLIVLVAMTYANRIKRQWSMRHGRS